MAVSAKVVGASGKGYSAEIRVTGLRETQLALRAFEPEIYKALRKSIRAQLARVRKGASGRYAGSYGVSIKDTKKNPGGAVFAKVGPRKDQNDWSSPATRAVIFEFAKSGKTPQAQAAIDSYQSRFGSPGRFLWAEWDSGTGRSVLANVEAELRDAERVLQTNLDKAGESF